MIAIIGAGFMGLGVALAFKERGFNSFVILEQNNEPLSATSGNSMRIVHSGIRQLQSLNFFEWLKLKKNKEKLLKLFPFFKPIKFCFSAPWYLKLVPNVLLKRWGLQKLSRNILIWEDGFLHDLNGAKAFFLEVFSNNLILNCKVSDIARNGAKLEVLTNAGKFKVDYAIMACFGSEFMQDFSPIYAWNIVADCYKPPSFEAYGEFIHSRALFYVDRGNELSVGTWYTASYPTDQEIAAAKQEAEILLKQSLDKVRIEIGVLPSFNSQPIRKPHIIFKDNVIKIYPAKFTTFLEIGYQVLSLLPLRV